MPVQRVLTAVACVLVLAGAAHAQAPGEEAEDALYRPSVGGDTAGTGQDRGPAAPALDPVEAWSAQSSLGFLAGAVMPFGTPSQFGDPSGPAVGAMLSWRRFVDPGDSDLRPFVDISLGALLADFSNDSADLKDLEPAVASTIGELDTSSTYLLITGRLGWEAWQGSGWRVTCWLGAGVGVERRSLDFLTAGGLAWDDEYHRSVAAGELGIGLEIRLGAVSLELRLTALALLGDTTPLAAGAGAGAGLGVRW